MNNHKTHASLARQAMHIMDADGEAAMWRFAAAVSTDPGEPPVSAELEDGSIIHLINGAYTFQDDPLREPANDCVRRSYTDRRHLPPAFGFQTPLFQVPNRETLCRKIVEFLLEQANEELNDNDLQNNWPEPSELREANHQVREVIDSEHQALAQPCHDLTDHLYAAVDSIVRDMLAKLPHETKATIKETARPVKQEQTLAA